MDSIVSYSEPTTQDTFDLGVSPALLRQIREKLNADPEYHISRAEQGFLWQVGVELPECRDEVLDIFFTRTHKKTISSTVARYKNNANCSNYAFEDLLGIARESILFEMTKFDNPNCTSTTTYNYKEYSLSTFFTVVINSGIHRFLNAEKGIKRSHSDYIQKMKRLQEEADKSNKELTDEELRKELHCSKEFLQDIRNIARGSECIHTVNDMVDTSSIRSERAIEKASAEEDLLENEFADKVNSLYSMFTNADSELKQIYATIVEYMIDTYNSGAFFNKSQLVRDLQEKFPNNTDISKKTIDTKILEIRRYFSEGLSDYHDEYSFLVMEDKKRRTEKDLSTI